MHIGFIMDGNRRWAEQRGLSSTQGHAAGAKALEEIIEACAKHGVSTITVYALSTENLQKRLQKELAGIFKLMGQWITKKHKHLQKHGIGLHFFGRLNELPQSLQRKIHKVNQVVKHNERIKLNVMLNYGGRSEIVDAVKHLIQDGVPAAKVNETLISQKLSTKDCPDPDLIIRTGGQKRISNFLIWQSSYAELYFTDVLWPDFNEAELKKALADYASRTRRFGGQDSLNPTQQTV
jgi:undecaprenyl diphosphate synthase